MYGRDAKDGHDGVANELLDGAPMRPQNFAQSREGAPERLTDDFRIVGFAECGRSDDVREKNRYELPFLRNGRSLGPG
jgi:hypothetical protein